MTVNALEQDDDIQAFLNESYEGLNQVELDLLALEQAQTGPESLGRIYRTLHTLKGNCGFLAFTRLEALAHAGETYLEQLQTQEHVPTSGQISPFLQVVDAIRQSLQAIGQTGSEPGIDQTDLLQALSHSTSSVDSDVKPDLQAKPDLSPDLSEVGNGENGDGTSSEVIPGPSLENNPGGYDLLVDRGVRVDVRLLDQMMNLVSELVLTRNQLWQAANRQAAIQRQLASQQAANQQRANQQRANQQTASQQTGQTLAREQSKVALAQSFDSSALLSTCQRLNLITNDLQTGIMKTRMQPLWTLWQKIPRLCRDLAQANGKAVQVEFQGAETELDRNVLEAIKDPLLHLVRNCLDHGIEPPAQRLAQGKPETGQICLQAFHGNGKVNIAIRDDGRGIDRDVLRQKARQRGLRSESQLAQSSDSQLLDLIFLPGFSTADQVTNLSGRGVGLEIVRSQVEKINGTVEVVSEAGQGCTFWLKIPLTLAIIPALIVTASGQRFAIPQASLQELVRLEGDAAAQAVETLYNVPVYRLREQILPLLYLEHVLFNRLNCQEGVLTIVVIQVDNGWFGLVVEAMHDIQDVVVKPLGEQLRHLKLYAGATLLEDGTPTLILDAAGLTSWAGLNHDWRTQHQQTSAAPTTDSEQLLVVRGPESARMGIPLAQLVRLENFVTQQVERVGQQLLIPYRDSILPLIDLNTIFASVVPSAGFQSTGTSHQDTSKQDTETQDSETQNTEMLPVVVVSVRQRLFGLIVAEILDIVTDSLEIRSAASRPGVQSATVIQGQITEILDLETLVQLANPHLLAQPVLPGGHR